jgi:hypothetical protein
MELKPGLSPVVRAVNQAALSLSDAVRRLASMQGGDDAAAAIATALHADPLARTLDLTDIAIGSPSLALLGDALACNCAIRILKLGWNAVGNNGAAVIGASLLRNSALHELHLESSGVGDDGARAIAAGLVDNATLQTLNLNGNIIGAGGGQQSSGQPSVRTLRFATSTLTATEFATTAPWLFPLASRTTTHSRTSAFHPID